jgi:membrane protein
LEDVSPESPEERRKRKIRARARFGKEIEKVKPGTYPFEVMKRVAVGVYNDGFIHAGNLAYLALLTIFPFVIVAAAVTRLFGQTEEGLAAVIALLQTMPPNVADVLEKPISDVIQARSGNLLWLGAVFGLWTTGSFIETIRDIIRRAYGVKSTRPFWEYRLVAIGIIVGSVVLAMLSFTLSILLSTIQAFVVDYLPAGEELGVIFSLFRFAPAFILFGSLYLLFLSLTPKRYRKKGCKKWPGPLFITFWWLATTALLPWALSALGGYDLTYGSLAGVMIALVFFFVIGLGVVIGAELNAALAETPEEELKEGEKAFYSRESI